MSKHFRLNLLRSPGTAAVFATVLAAALAASPCPMRAQDATGPPTEGQNADQPAGDADDLSEDGRSRVGSAYPYTAVASANQAAEIAGCSRRCSRDLTWCRASS